MAKSVWLKDAEGNKIVPKIIASEVYDANGNKEFDKYLPINGTTLLGGTLIISTGALQDTNSTGPIKLVASENGYASLYVGASGRVAGEWLPGRIILQRPYAAGINNCAIIEAQGDADNHNTTYYLPTVAEDTTILATQNYVSTLINANNYVLPVATSSVLGGIQIGYSTNNTSRTYAVELDSSNKAYVNVPWEGYTLSAATSSALGGIKVGYTTNNTSRTYAVELDANNKAYVNVPWDAAPIDYLPVTGGNFKYTYNSNTYTVGGLSTAVVDPNSSVPYHQTILTLGNSGMANLHAGHSQGQLLMYGKDYSSVALMAENGSHAGTTATLYLPWANGTLATQDYVNSAIASSVATSDTLGGIKIGYTTDTTNKKYAVELDSNNKAYVSVPWEAGSSVSGDYLPLTGGDFYYYDSTYDTNISAGGLSVSFSGTSPLQGEVTLTLGNNLMRATDWGGASGRLRLYSTSSGYIALSPASTASNYTLTLPATTDTLATQSYVDDAIANIDTSGGSGTDEKVKLSSSTAAANRPIAFAPINPPTSGTAYELNYNSNIYINPSSGTLRTTILQAQTLQVPTTSGGSTYGVGSNGQVIKSNGSTSYWGTIDTTQSSFASLGWSSDRYTSDTSFSFTYSGTLSLASSYLVQVVVGDLTAGVVSSYATFVVSPTSSSFTGKLLAPASAGTIELTGSMSGSQTVFTVSLSGISGYNMASLYLF